MYKYSQIAISKLSERFTDDTWNQLFSCFLVKTASPIFKNRSTDPLPLGAQRRIGLNVFSVSIKVQAH